MYCGAAHCHFENAKTGIEEGKMESLYFWIHETLMILFWLHCHFGQNGFKNNINKKKLKLKTTTGVSERPPTSEGWMFQHITNRTGPQPQFPNPSLCPMGLFTYGLTGFWAFQLLSSTHIVFANSPRQEWLLSSQSLWWGKRLWIWQGPEYHSAQASSWLITV